MELEFSGDVIFWRGPAPWHFIAVPEAECQAIASESARLTYGWGVIPVSARIGATEFTTSLFPKDGGYLVPIKASVRRAESLDVGDAARVMLALGG